MHKSLSDDLLQPPKPTASPELVSTSQCSLGMEEAPTSPHLPQTVHAVSRMVSLLCDGQSMTQGLNLKAKQLLFLEAPNATDFCVTSLGPQRSRASEGGGSPELAAAKHSPSCCGEGLYKALGGE